MLMYVVTLLKWSPIFKLYEETNKICVTMRLDYVYKIQTSL